VQEIDPDFLQCRGCAGAGFLSFLEPEKNFPGRPEELEAGQDDHQEKNQAEQALDQCKPLPVGHETPPYQVKSRISPF
jgi:hypothetical protein